MNLLDRSHCAYVVAGIALLATVGCNDATPTANNQRQLAPRASRDISDGAHGGNPEVFFLPPLVPPPPQADSVGDEAFQAGLPVTMDVRDMTASGNPIVQQFATTDITVTNFAYQVSWKVSDSNLDLTHTYRIEVVIGSKLVAFADVLPVDNMGNLRNKGTNDIIPINDHRTIPIKVRVELGWNCKNGNSCVTQVVPNPIPPGQVFIVQTNDHLNSAAFTDTWHAGTFDVLVTIEDVTDQESVANGGPGCSLGVTSMLSREHCVKFTTDPRVTFTTPVTVGTCVPNPGDLRQLLIKYDVDEAPTFLDDVPPPVPCPTSFGLARPSSNPLVRFASAALSRLGSGLGWAMGLKTAQAIDLGVGGSVDAGGGFSFVALGFPAQMSEVSGDQQTAIAGTVLPIAPTVRISAVHDVGDGRLPSAVPGEQVTCTANTAGSGLQVNGTIVTSAPAIDNLDGTYTCPAWRLSQTAGANTVTVTATTLDGSVVIELGGGKQGALSGAVTFTATGSSGIQ